MAEPTIFRRILDGEIPADVVYEDDHCLAFRDINPQAPIHVVLIPKREIATLDDFGDGDHSVAGHLLLAVGKVAEKLGIQGRYRVVVNCGAEAGQEVMHVHFHILAGRAFGWPPG